jgi:hypothetical protein
MKIPLILHRSPFVANKKTNMWNARPALVVIVLFFAAAFSGFAQASQAPAGGTATAPSPTPDTPYSVVERGANHRVWQKFSYETTVDRQVVAHSHSYTEIATGLAHLVGNQWVDSSPEIQITAAGAQATNAQHSVSFLANINASGAVYVTTPEGKHLVSNIQGLSYFDTATSSSVLIGTIKDSTGQLLDTKDRALFPDAFSGLSADVLYVNSISGFEQLVVLTAQLPSPTQWNMNPSTVLLQVITEFLNSPSPQIALFQDDSGTDQHLDFGIMKMGLGYAFALGSEENKVRVTKEWLVQDGRTFLIESVRLTDILPLMHDLPPLPPGSASLSTPTGSVPHQLASHRRLLPPKLAANTAAHSTFRTPQSALSSSHSALVKGVALDYTMLTTQTNFLAQSDTTYYVSGSVSLTGSNVFEGDAVIKYATNASIQLNFGLTSPSVTFLGSSYRPIVFTAKDCNTVGETISGSTGSPTGYYANPALSLSVSPSAPGLSSVRFAYAMQALQLQLSGSSSAVSDAQFINCQQGLVSTGGATFNVRNALFANTLTNAVMGSGMTVTAENVTFSGSAYLAAGASFSSGSSFSLTNCILSNVTNLFAGVSTTNADYNGFYQSPSFGTHIAPTISSYPFQTVGAGGFYLATDSLYRNYGTTNLNSLLLSDIQKKTTYPPIVYSNTTVAVDTAFSPQAQRDTDQPDIGYNYDPLDYCFGGVEGSGNITFAPGTAVGWFRTKAGYSGTTGYGLQMDNGKVVTFSGTEQAPCAWVRANTVQETVNGNWPPLYGAGGITGNAWPNISDSPELHARFTLFSCLAAEGQTYRDNYGWLTARCTHCEFHDGDVGYYNVRHYLTNCLLDRCAVFLHTDWSDSAVAMRNCTERGHSLDLERWNSGTNAVVSVRDCAFDSVTVITNNPGIPANTDYDYNAFLTNWGETLPPGPHDKIVTNFNWRTGTLGAWYLPTNSPLIDAGSLTNAGLAGLYHFTTQTNQVKEATTPVDIGYHYVALDANGNPVDTDGDGVSDYLEDANGNGSVDSGETDWQSATDLGLKVIITRPPNNSVIP